MTVAQEVHSILKKIAFLDGNADPCLLIKKGSNCIMMSLVYMDDNFCIRHKLALSLNSSKI